MRDITPAFNQLLAERQSPTAKPPRASVPVDSFLREANRIHSHIASLHRELLDVRRAYLSIAPARKTHAPGRRPGEPAQRPLTDREREEVDSTAKQTIRELNASVRALEEAEQLRRETTSARIRSRFGRRGLGALGAWAAGSGGGGGGRGGDAARTEEHEAEEERAREVAAHRDGVVLFLRQRLEMCCRVQQEMMEKRLTRELEKNRSVLAKAGGTGFESLALDSTQRRGPAPTQVPSSSSTAAAAAAAAAAQPPASHQTFSAWLPEAEGLTEEQVQMFEKGNQDMMKHMDKELVKIRTAQQSLVEISELQNVLMGNLSVQREQIDLLAADQDATAENVHGGNRELKKATQRTSVAKLTFLAASGLCAFLVAWDLLI